MITRSPLPRSKKPLPKRRKGGPRRGRIVDEKMLAWIHTQPCLLALRNPDTHRCNGALTAHHVREVSAPKDDTRIVPLCVGAHLHDGSSVSVERLGRIRWQAFHGIDLTAEIANYQAMFVSEVGR